uniref:Large ribosomal subunit protein uL6c n=1 Tax=Hommersandiophycus borowitzkae TaxID=268573 RepID=A0A1G4NUJ2_9FLOR|nr:Ribosomal protein L6 [Hommersandiophycus borowitzkae]SCW22216.1 Ribosomal protein L6 [Hommersandiophycus borowitzkae]
MSRIGKKEINLSNEIQASIKNNIVTIKGPKGELQEKISTLINIEELNSAGDSKLLLTTIDNTKKAQELHGLSRTLINNMIIGVQDGFTKRLEIRGVGYRSQIDGANLILNVGYSHPVIIPFPDGITIKVENNVNIIVSGINKMLVGQTAAQIRSIRPPEPYKGKGIRYRDEIVKKKIGKAGK